MAGNVWDWCWDLYGNYDTGSPSDPRGASSGANRVIRGGSWQDHAIFCRVARRHDYIPSLTLSYIGFRVALFADASARTAPIVTTVAAVPGVGEGSFTVSGSVTSDGGTPVTRRGIVYGPTATPSLGTTMDSPATGTGIGAFSSTLTGLSPETTYYARAYATSTLGTGYGADITFKTAPATPVGFALIPAGTFQMGDALDGLADAPVRTVNVSAFYMGKTEVTKAEWDQVRTWGLSRGYTDLAVGGGKASNHPVQGVTWWDVIKWCNTRSEKDGLDPVYTVNGAVLRTGTTVPTVNWGAKGYRLPTEAEWEKASRGGLNGKRFPWGNSINHTQANYLSDSVYFYDVSPTRGRHPTYMVGGEPYTSPVSSFAANEYGLYDMSGNVWEWCWDWYGADASGALSDPKGSTTGSVRVFRGGSWGGGATFSRVAYRGWLNPLELYDLNGFRPARGL
jgi:formylglycine-generating enzyme required for sulfatase activity